MATSCKAHDYLYAGLVVRSGLALPELGELEPDPRRIPDILVDWEPPVAEKLPEYRWETDGRRWACLSWPGVGSYRIEKGNRIVVTPSTGAADSDLRTLLLGPAWAVINMQLGRVVLHAAACRDERHTFLLCGRSGAGKSSLLAALAELGLDPVADDTCVVGSDPAGAFVLYSGLPRFKLWQESLVRLSLEPRAGGRVVQAADKYLVPWDSAPPAELPLVGGVYVLDWGATSIDPLTGLEGLRRLAQAAVYFPGMLRQEPVLGDYWELLLQVVSRVPAFTFRRPRDWDGFRSAAECLKAHMGAL